MVLHTARSVARRAGRLNNKTRLAIVRLSGPYGPEYEAVNLDEGGDASAADWRGVEKHEAEEHHLQAALSSASLIHSRSAKPSSPSTTPRLAAAATKAAAAAAATDKATAPDQRALAYHIPTPDATGLVLNYETLYPQSRWVDPVNYIKFSDTVEESSYGYGGLGYMMDDDDAEWLKTYHATPESSSSGGATTADQGRAIRAKGKEKEKDGDVTASPATLSEDQFEYLMGVMEKWTEDNVPMLHTNLALMPAFTSIEPLFITTPAPSFFPSNEQPRGLTDPRILARHAKNVYPHWKKRRELRQGKSIFPILNFDETNDGDPYVCFRRRDVRLTRKTRRTDTQSVERMQKLQGELTQAYALARMVLQREREKRTVIKCDHEVWEAKWKMFEVKRKWPSLGLTKDEEELITGRALAVQAQQDRHALAHGYERSGLTTSTLPAKRSRQDREREREREDKERQQASANAALRASRAGLALPEKLMTPEAIREREALMRQKIEEDVARRKSLAAVWEDCTDATFQPLPVPKALRAFRNLPFLDPAFRDPSSLDPSDPSLPPSEWTTAERLAKPPSFRLRRGRGGAVRLDRRAAIYAGRNRGPMPKSNLELREWLFGGADDRPSRKRPTSIDDVATSDAEEEEDDSRRKRLRERWRYDREEGTLNVTMGIREEEDRIVVDDFDPKYVRTRLDLLRDDDLEALQPDLTPITQAHIAYDTPVEVPPPTIIARPPAPQQQSVAHFALQQQQQQQQLEQLQRDQIMRFQLMQQQQQLQQQQRNAVAAQAQAAQSLPNAGAQANGARPVMAPKRTSSVGPGQNVQLQPQSRPSASPAPSLQQQQQALALAAAAGSPQLGNGRAQQLQAQAEGNAASPRRPLSQPIALPPNGVTNNGGNFDLAAAAAAAGYSSVQAFTEAKKQENLLRLKQVAAAQAANGNANFPPPAAASTTTNGNSNTTANGNTNLMPNLPTGGLQLKLPPHASARLGAAQQQRS